MTAPRLILVRHAHAEWPDWRGEDFDRPLTPKGLADARAAGCAIRDAGHRPVLLISSPARRARETAELIAEELHLAAAAVRLVEELYNASAEVLEAESRAAALGGTLVALVAHNPGVSDLSRKLANDPRAPSYRPAEWRILALPGG